MKDKKMNKLWMVIFLIAIFVTLSHPSTVQKTSSTEWFSAGFGVVLLVAGILLMMVPGGFPFGIMMGVIAMTALGGGTFLSGLIGLFTPDSHIPVFVWIIGALFIFIIAIKRGKK